MYIRGLDTLGNLFDTGRMPKVDMSSVNAVAKRIYKINKTFKNV
jgi:hypothetical protein